MTIPSTNVTITSIKTEFPSPPTPTSMSMFYRGGTYVPSGQTATPVDGTPIPTSGTIRMGEFRGQTKIASGGIVVSWSGSTTNVSVATGGRTCGFSVVTNGTTLHSQGSSAITTAGPNWYSPTTTSIGSSYWVKATFTTTTAPSGSGNTTTGTFGSWGQITANQTWTWSTATGQTEWAGTMTLQFSLTNGGAVVGTGSVGFDVGYTP